MLDMLVAVAAAIIAAAVISDALRLEQTLIHPQQGLDQLVTERLMVICECW